MVLVYLLRLFEMLLFFFFYVTKWKIFFSTKNAVPKFFFILKKFIVYIIESLVGVIKPMQGLTITIIYHICVIKSWHMWWIWIIIKRHISGIIPFRWWFSKQFFLSSFLFKESESLLILQKLMLKFHTKNP